MKDLGLIRKYNVERVDGKTDPEGTEYFVLKLNSGDIPTNDALRAYARAVENDYPKLANDLRMKATEECGYCDGTP